METKMTKQSDKNGYRRNLCRTVNKCAVKKHYYFCMFLSIGIINENKVLKQWYSSFGFNETGFKKFPHLPFTVCFMEKKITKKDVA